MVPPKPSGVIGEGSDTGKDGDNGEDGRSCANLGRNPPIQPPIIFLAIWSSLGETSRKKTGSSFPSPTHVDFFPSGPQIWFSPEEALRRGRKRCDLFTSFALEVSGVHWIWRSR